MNINSSVCKIPLNTLLNDSSNAFSTASDAHHVLNATNQHANETHANSQPSGSRPCLLKHEIPMLSMQDIFKMQALHLKKAFVATIKYHRCPLYELDWNACLLSIQFE